MERFLNRSILIAVGAFILGWIVGLFVFGWGLTPIEYTGAGPQHLFEEDRAAYLIALADLYSFEKDDVQVKDALKAWEPDEASEAICQLAALSLDSAESARLVALAVAVNDGVGCGPSALPGAEPAADEGGGRGLGFFVLLCGLLAILAIVAVAIFLVWQRRAGRPVEDITADRPPAPPVADDTGGDQQVIPLARFQTTFVRGHDTYDDSFSIESAEGDFLGECGVGISETIGADESKNVTAFEVWLFDKNDIRTVTKVIMSDHAFFDEAIKAKLAPKGEPVLARPNETIVLETAALIINASISDMEYGTGALPPQSYFERFTVELSAWAKGGDFGEPDVQGRVDEILEF